MVSNHIENIEMDNFSKVVVLTTSLGIEEDEQAHALSHVAGKSLYAVYFLQVLGCWYFLIIHMCRMFIYNYVGSL